MCYWKTFLAMDTEAKGKPETLSGNLSGRWSVRIDSCNRIVFRISEENIEILQCGTHYRMS